MSGRGTCMVGVHSRGTCIVGACAWQGDMCGKKDECFISSENEPFCQLIEHE